MKPSSRPPAVPPHPRRNRRHLIWGGSLLAGLVLLFLAEPILRYPSAHYCFADFVQSFSLIRVEPRHAPSNPFMGDPAVIYHPWTIFNRAEYRAARIPVWNPYNGGGVPHLANYQSGVVSPYNLPFYPLDFKTGLLVSAFLKLFAIAAFTFLFLRACGLRQAAALVGATGFTFAGYHVAWVSGAITATAATLPASLFFTEVVLRRVEARRRGDPAPARLTAPFAGLILSLAVGLVAGHPENLYFGGLLLTSYLAFRLWQLRSRFGGTELAALAGRFVICALAAVLLAAIQLLPFLEYLVHSEVITGRSGLSAGLASRPKHLLPLLLTPHVLGSAAGPYRMVSSVVPFPEAIAPYAGAMVLFLAVLSSFLLRVSSHVRFFAAVMAFWLVYVSNPLGIAFVFRAIPGLSHLPINRGHDVWLFAVSCAAAWLLDALIERRPGAPRTLVIVGAGLGMLAAGLLAARWLVGRYREPIEAAGPASLEAVRSHLTFFAWTFALGVLAAAVVRASRSAAWRNAGAALLIGVAFLQTGFLLRGFNPTIEDRLVYPVTEEMDRLKELVGGDTLLVTGGRSASLVADTNMVYRLSLPNNYDGIWIRHYDRLYRRRFGAGSFPRTPLRFDPLGLDLFGVDYVLARGPMINTELADRRGLTLRPTPLAPKPRRAVQTFLATENRLQGVAVYATCAGPDDPVALTLRLEEAEAREAVAERTLSCRNFGRTGGWATLSFPALESSGGRRYRLVAQATGGLPAAGVALHAWSGFRYGSGMLAVEGVRQEGTLAFDFAYDLDSFKPLATLKDRTLYHYRGGRSRYYSVGRAVLAADDESALRRLEDPAHDPAEEVVLSDPPEILGPDLANRDPGRVEIVSEEATRIELEVTRSEPGYLVLAKPHYPGWKATVDGVTHPLLRANYAFVAVEVPAGRRRVVVRYEPASVRWGATLSLTTLIALGGWAVWQSRRPVRRPQI